MSGALARGGPRSHWFLQTARHLCSTPGPVPRRPMRSGGGAVRVPTGLRSVDFMVLVTINVARDTPPDRHFSAWSRPKPAPDPLPGPSVASGVIPTKGGKNGPVPSTPGRASTGRWRSSPWKRCNHAPPRGRGQGAPRTARCIKTRPPPSGQGKSRVREHPAPLGALRLLHGVRRLVLGVRSGSTPHRLHALVQSPPTTDLRPSPEGAKVAAQTERAHSQILPCSCYSS